ncbi:hypothetical protein AHAS_Ahas07G0056300 [Arachis hypogaea]
MSCDSGFTQQHRGFKVVGEYNPGASAPAEVGGSATPAEAGGSATPVVDDLVWGHPYDLWTKRNLPDRFTPSRFDQGMMGRGLNWLIRKK